MDSYTSPLLPHKETIYSGKNNMLNNYNYATQVIRQESKYGSFERFCYS